MSTRFLKRRPAISAVLALAVALLGLVLLLPLGCGEGDPSRPTGDSTRDYAAPPAELPDEFPAGGENGDSTSPGDPGQSDVYRLVCMRAYHDPVEPNVGLWVLSTGEAAAMAPGDSRRMTMSLSPDTLDLIATWFAEARFNELVGTYLSDHPMGVRIFDLLHQESPMGPIGHVQGQEDLLPQDLLTLCGRLEGLAEYVLEHGEPIPDTPVDPPPGPDLWVHGDLDVNPVSGAPGTPRTIRLHLRNSGTEAVTLHFPTTQLHDFLLMDAGPWGPPGDDEPGDPGTPGGAPGDPGMPGGHRGDEPVEPGDPDDPTDPPDSTGSPGDTVIAPPPPPDSGWVPPDSGWVPPPDTTWVPPDSGWSPPPDSLPPGPGLLWNWSYGLLFPQVLTEILLEPGQVVSYEVNWNGRDNAGNPVAAGVYVIYAVVPCREPVRIDPVRVQVLE